MSKLSIILELWEMLRVRKKWWLIPIVVFLIVLSALIIATQSTSFGPIIYTLF